MKEFEFYSYDDEVWYKDSDGHTEQLTEHNTEVVDTMFETIKSEYPDSSNALSEIYHKSELNVTYYKYVVVKRFIKCNFSKVDTTYIDIESFGSKDRMNFEKVDCPMRGECPFEDIICMPRFSSHLTKRELDVARLLFDGKRKKEIAEAMFLSFETVNNHVRRIYKKLGVHSEAEFDKYCVANKIFG